MNKYFVNRELKGTFISLMITLLVALGIFLIGLNIFLYNISAIIYENNIEMTGKLVEKYPELETSIINIYNEKTTENHLEKGGETLKQYGYTQDMALKILNSDNKIYFKLILELISFFVLLTAMILSITFLGFLKLYVKIEKTTYIIEKVIEGDFAYQLDEAGEELFHVLGHQFNKMSNCHKLSIDNLKKEKIFLKNIIGDISHQLKTPIATLIVTNDIMTIETDMPQPTRTYFLERNKKQLERIEWLTKNLLKLAMLDAGIIIFDHSKVPVIAMIKKAISSIEYLRQEKNIAIHMDENLVDSYFYGDANWTGEAILNIVKNSIEHTPEYGQVNIQIEQTKLFTTINISDNGEGIDEKEIPKIFERFHKCKSEYKTDSVGIGLSLSKRIIDGQEGTITVKSKKMQGSLFSIVLTNS